LKNTNLSRYRIKYFYTNKKISSYSSL